MSRIGEAILRASEAARERGEPVPPDVARVGTLRLIVEDAPHESPWTFDESAAALASARALSAVPKTNGHAAAQSAPLAAPGAAPVPALGDDERSTALPRINPRLEERIVMSGKVLPEGVEQYRQLAAALHQAQTDHGLRVVMVTSAVLAEGKSVTSLNLALTLSESYRRRVLLIDADLRRPTLHDFFQVENASGLSDGLRRESPVTFPTLALSNTLALLPSGPPDSDPMAGLTSARMRQLIDEARSKFDWVIIDTPPVALLPDANLVAAAADGIVLVVAAAHAPFDIIRRAAKALGRKKILGVVLNRAEAEPVSYSPYGSYARQIRT